jgi:hypothetical protein
MTPRAASLIASLVLTTGIAGCGSAEKHKESIAAPSAAHIAETERAEATSPKTTPAPVEHYTGLGSTSAAFSAENPGKPSPNPPPGTSWYTILSTNSAGRVTAFRMEENDEPTLEARERVGSLAGNILPSDASQTSLNGEECIVWRSATLKRLIGDEYAAATTSPWEASAEMRAESSPSCHGASAREASAEGEDRVGSNSHATDSTFCEEHECIGDFTTEGGTVVECSDGTYSHAGGIQGACSDHGGEKEG